MDHIVGFYSTLDFFFLSAGQRSASLAEITLVSKIYGKMV